MTNAASALNLLETDIVIGSTVVLTGPNGGKYPYGNSIVVIGAEETLLIDPSLGLIDRDPLKVDRMLVSHAHEDHLAGVHLHPQASVHAHTEDVGAVRSFDLFLEVYGMPSSIADQWGPQIIDEFHYVPRLDATSFEDGARFDLGGGISVEVVHLPGHTRGHCGFMIEPDGVFFVADVDLSAFGPYYGDHWSDLEDFERSIAKARTIQAKHYATFHHKGVVAGQDEFVRQLDAFGAVIAKREVALLEFLAEPATMSDIVAHRFIYRPGVDLLFADHVERTSMTMHLTRLQRTGAVLEIEPGRFRTV